MAHFPECGLRAYIVSLESAWRNLCVRGWKLRGRCNLTPTSACRTWVHSATCGSPGGVFVAPMAKLDVAFAGRPLVPKRSSAHLWHMKSGTFLEINTFGPVKVILITSTF